MSRFVELCGRVYRNGRYISNDMCFSLDDIARVVRCTDDYSCTNIITKDGEKHTINERFNDVVAKIRLAEKGERK